MDFPKIESRALKYGFSNARVKGMKGLLLPMSFMEELIRVRTIDAMAELLQRTHYKEDLVSLSMHHSGSELIELGASRHFEKLVSKIKKMVPKDDLPIVNALLRRWDILNLKTLVDAKRAGKKYEEIRPYLFAVGDLSYADFERIAKSDELGMFDEIKRTTLGSEMLSSSTADFSKNMRGIFANAMKNMDMFTQLETILDAYAYLFMEKGLSEVSGKDVSLFRRLLKKEIDARNILMIERLKKYNYSIEKIQTHLIKGGTLSESVILKLLESKDYSAILSVAKSKFPKLELPESNASLTSLEIAIAAERLIAFYRGTLTIGVILGFILLKYEEIRNLRKIAKAKEFRIPESQIKEMLVVV